MGVAIGGLVGLLKLAKSYAETAGFAMGTICSGPVPMIALAGV